MKSVVLFLLCFACWTNSLSIVHAQSLRCSGNLGANIFTDGDFGRGEEVILQDDPGISPGYAYGRQPPPQDGLYVITNNTAGWPDIFPTWIGIQDNSEDPFGYMMVVNASFEPGLFYEQEVRGLCENTLYDFSADIINVVARTVSDHIKPNVSFLINGDVAFSTGEVPQDEQWHSYGFTFTTGPGEFSVTLSLRNNSPGGIGNDLALDNISFRPCGPQALILPQEVANICEDGNPILLDATLIGDQYPLPAWQWQESLDGGQTWIDIEGEQNDSYAHDKLEAGFYYYRYQVAASEENLANDRCRVISNIKVVHVVPKYYTIADTICQGLTVRLGNQDYDESGTYIDSFISSIGCDSIVTLLLTVVPDPGISADLRIEDQSCSDSKDGALEVTDIQHGIGPYSVLIDDILFVDHFTYDSLNAGDYQVVISDRYGCNWDSLVSIKAPEPLILDLGPDLVVVLGDRVILEPVVNDTVQSYRWFPEGSVLCTESCDEIALTPSSDIVLKLDVVSQEGCQATDSIRIDVIVEDLVFVPNAFSPDGDGINDWFRPFVRGETASLINRFLLFDRWGNIIWDQREILPSDPGLGWDGLDRSGQLSNPGVYTYLMQIQFIDGATRQFAGSVHLIR